MITKEMMLPFCSDDETKFTLHQPFTVGQWTYATDGKVVLRVPSADVNIEQEQNAKVPNAAVIIQFHDWENKTGYDNLPEIPEWPSTIICKACEGFEMIECSHCGSMVECKSCGGEGETEPFPLPMLVGDVLFNVKYLRLLATLPGVKVRRGSNPADKLATFIFDGGDGVLMGFKTEKETLNTDTLRELLCGFTKDQISDAGRIAARNHIAQLEELI